MAEKQIRLLNADEIECRVGYISDKGLSLLLYKDARVDMKILDEVYGASNWQRHHEVIGGNLYCTVSIWDEEKGQWISKQDVGTKSNTEKEKGEASDSFKRACFSHGIGRELYTAPFIWIPASKTDIRQRDNRYVTNDKFRVSAISYNSNREISSLTVINQDGNVVYNLASAKPASNRSKDMNIRENPFSNKEAEGYGQAINRELERTGIALQTVLERYGISGIDEMDEDTYRKAMAGLRRTKTKAA